MPDFYIPSPEDHRLSDVLRNPARITLRKIDGAEAELEAKPGMISVVEEHPQVDRMGGDWGAICEVFRKSNYYYAAISGVSLTTGDIITIRYKSQLRTVRLKVIDLENGRARIDPPEISAGSGASAADSGRQNP